MVNMAIVNNISKADNLLERSSFISSYQYSKGIVKGQLTQNKKTSLINKLSLKKLNSISRFLFQYYGFCHLGTRNANTHLGHVVKFRGK